MVSAPRNTKHSKWAWMVLLFLGWIGKGRLLKMSISYNAEMIKWSKERHSMKSSAVLPLTSHGTAHMWQVMGVMAWHLFGAQFTQSAEQIYSWRNNIRTKTKPKDRSVSLVTTWFREQTFPSIRQQWFLIVCIDLVSRSSLQWESNVLSFCASVSLIVKNRRSTIFCPYKSTLKKTL